MGSTSGRARSPSDEWQEFPLRLALVVVYLQQRDFMELRLRTVSLFMCSSLELTSSPLPLPSPPERRSSSDLPPLRLRDLDLDRERDRDRPEALSPSSSVLMSDASPNRASAVTETFFPLSDTYTQTVIPFGSETVPQLPTYCSRV